MAFWVRLVVVALALCTCFSATGMAAQRVVMFEECTSATCPPCAPANCGCSQCNEFCPEGITEMLESYGDQVAAVKWHVWWPAHNPLDPFHRSNPNPVVARIQDQYHIVAAPWVVIDGQNQSEAGETAVLRAIIDSRLLVPSPIAIAATSTRDGNIFEVSIDISVEVPFPGDTRLFVALTEEHAPCSASQNGCPNGEFMHHDVFRKINNNNVLGGVPIDLTTPAVVLHYEQTLSCAPVVVTTPAVNPEEIHVVVWVQDFSSLEMIQAAESDPVTVVGIPEAGVPVITTLAQNQPNPFMTSMTPSTSIAYTLAEASNVQLRIYDVEGKLVRELANGWNDSGTHSALWDGTDGAGKGLGSGIYFYKLIGPNVRETRRMLLLR